MQGVQPRPAPNGTEIVGGRGLALNRFSAFGGGVAGVDVGGVIAGGIFPGLDDVGQEIFNDFGAVMVSVP